MKKDEDVLEKDLIKTKCENWNQTLQITISWKLFG